MIGIDVIIPVYKPDHNLLALIQRLENQTVPVHKILLMNTEQKYFDRLIYGTSFLDKHRILEINHLSRREFDHGKTRNRAVKKSEAEIFIMMTQDALPADEFMVEELIKPLDYEKVAVSYARQLPAPGCNVLEQLARSFNYPPEDKVKSKADIPELGIKTYFCSNVCAAYKRGIFDALGGFGNHMIFNEDMIYAAGAVNAGFSIAYASKAKVIHSHNYTGKQYFHRYFDLGVSQADHPEIFKEVPAEKEGKSLAKSTITTLWKEGHKKILPLFFTSNFSKYAGFWLGRHYRHLSSKMILKCTMNREYWGKK